MPDPDWPHIVRQHHALVWQTTYRLLANHADAADCFQDTFLAAWQFSSRHAVLNWPALLQQLATARALDLLRQKIRRRKNLAPAETLADLPAATTSPLDHAHTNDLAAHLRLALADLPPQLAQTYALRHLSNLAYDEIAQHLGISTSAVGVNLHRATQQLRERLTPLLAPDK